MALSIFTNKLREPIGSHVRSMQPDTLAAARAICIREQYLSNLRFVPHSKPQLKPPQIPVRTNYPQYKPLYSQYPPNRFNYPKPPFVSNAPNIYYNHRPFSNNSPKQIMAKPEPMDTSSLNVAPKQFTYQKPQAPFQPNHWKRPASNHEPNNLQRQRLYNIEEIQDDPQQSQYEEQLENEYPHEEYDETIEQEPPIVEIEEDQDFRSDPSENSDT